MDIVKYKITPKTIKIEIRKTSNYTFDFNNDVEIDAADREALLRLYKALELFFKKDNVNDVKNYISPNQTNILDQINEVGDLE